MKRRDMYNLYKSLVLVVLMVVGGAGSAWGQYQSYSIASNLDENRGQSTEILYLQPNASKTVNLQEAAENLDGFVRWYIVDADGHSNPTAKGLSKVEYNDVGDEYANGFVWWNSSGTATSAGVALRISVTMTENDLSSGKILVCEATSLNDAETGWTGGHNSTQYVRTSPLITFERRYILRNANDDASYLTGLKNALGASSYDDWRTSEEEFRALAALSDEARSVYFAESYELHTPLSQGTNYRLSRQIGNYYINRRNSNNVVSANRIRWNVFDDEGTKLTGDDDNIIANTNIWTHTFDETEGIEDNASDVQVLYLVAEIAQASTTNQGGANFCYL